MPEVPVEYGPGKVGETIRRIRNALERGQGLSGLTADQLYRWEALREHNRHDCVGMRKVCLTAIEGIEAFDGARGFSLHDRLGSPEPDLKTSCAGGGIGSVRYSINA